MALPVSKPAPEFAFLPPLGDLFVMLQPGPQMWLFINWVKVVREVRINSDLWVLIMLKGNDDLNGSLLSDYPQLNAIPILFYLYTISTILPNVNIWNLIAGERTFSTNFQRKVQIRMCWKTSWKHFVKNIRCYVSQFYLTINSGFFQQNAIYIFSTMDIFIQFQGTLKTHCWILGFVKYFLSKRSLLLIHKKTWLPL